LLGKNEIKEIQVLEQKYLQKLNFQNDKMKILKNQFQREILNFQKIENINLQLNSTFLNLVQNKKIKRSDFMAMSKKKLLRKNFVGEIDRWLNLPETEIERVDFIDYEDRKYDFDQKEEENAEEDNFPSYMKCRILYEDYKDKIPRPHVINKSHSTNFDVKAKGAEQPGKPILLTIFSVSRFGQGDGNWLPSGRFVHLH
jgi:hypothetical protein